MLLKYQVRGDNDEIYFAKNIGERDSIVILRLHDSIIDKVIQTDVFECQSKLVTLEPD